MRRFYSEHAGRRTWRVDLVFTRAKWSSQRIATAELMFKIFFPAGIRARPRLVGEGKPQLTSPNSEEQRNEKTPLLAKDARNGGSDQMDRKPKQPECLTLYC